MDANGDQRDTNSDGIGNLCDADLNNDCIVNYADGAALSAFMGCTSGPPCPNADLDGDADVDFDDLDILQSFYLFAPGPSADPCE